MGVKCIEKRIFNRSIAFLIAHRRQNLRLGQPLNLGNAELSRLQQAIGFQCVQIHPVQPFLRLTNRDKRRPGNR